MAWRLHYIYRDWELVLRHIVYGHKEFDEVLEEDLDEGTYCDEYGRCKAILFDDIGKYFSKRERKNLSEEKMAWVTELETIREKIACILGTGLSPEHPVKGIRMYYTGRVQHYYPVTSRSARFWSFYRDASYHRPHEDYYTPIYRHQLVWEDWPTLEVKGNYDEKRRAISDIARAARIKIEIRQERVRQVYHDARPIERAMLMEIYKLLNKRRTKPLTTAELASSFKYSHEDEAALLRKSLGSITTAPVKLLAASDMVTYRVHGPGKATVGITELGLRVVDVITKVQAKEKAEQGNASR